ncbi:hypothetical protein Pmar_PMAR001123 [Perkinsus marinus ATCC 50983]|uniref:Uncharacterized protein n=1 Tax=Perkinsus marinus (strain ATCC 50983 / TXsc) TaxID=423536 RepID=C5KSX6_PERM5|nr:hypothetical protein Pmar_PMAR001123 [Perkinsus marinus ATCC 50983]EER12326.1 hypothetical protein Pmar_PMAR001123 [Perkinsus marinus ATCC 50983]|eukprot:XP_002780531.1 hypothetical protein Pmar_PMAR001123 [Perkinsus marinus ATCC 50983]
MRIMILLVLMCAFASLIDGSVELRRAAAIPISYPSGCTGAHKPASEPFCAVGTIDQSDVFKLNMTVYIFDIDDPTKSVYFHIESATTSGGPLIEPAGLNITGGGRAKVMGLDIGPIVYTGYMSAVTVGDGRGKYDPSTDTWTADIKVQAQVELYQFGKRTFYLFMSNVFAASNDLIFGVDLGVVLQKQWGNPVMNITMTFIFNLNSKMDDMYTWDLFGQYQWRIWGPFSPPDRYTTVFIDKEFQILST